MTLRSVGSFVSNKEHKEKNRFRVHVLCNDEVVSMNTMRV
jgi:hypothetical protein